jgi:hypothetical protein
MHCNHGKVVDLRHLIQGNPQASGDLLQAALLVVVVGKNEVSS